MKDWINNFYMIKLLMKYLLFAGVMAVVGCTEEKMEEVFIEQPNSFHIKVEGDEAFALNIPSGGKIGINGKEVQVLSKGLVSLYEVPAEEKYTVYYPLSVQLQEERMKFNMPKDQIYRTGGVDVAACPYYAVADIGCVKIDNTCQSGICFYIICRFEIRIG